MDYKLERSVKVGDILFNFYVWDERWTFMSWTEKMV